MALNAASLTSAIINDLESKGFNTGNEFSYTVRLISAISEGVVTHIQSNAELIPISTDTGSAGAGIITGKVG